MFFMFYYQLKISMHEAREKWVFNSKSKTCKDMQTYTCKHHANIMKKTCKNHANIMQTTCKTHAKIMQHSCKRIMQHFTQHHANSHTSCNTKRATPGKHHTHSMNIMQHHATQQDSCHIMQAHAKHATARAAHHTIPYTR